MIHIADADGKKSAWPTLELTHPRQLGFVGETAFMGLEAGSMILADVHIVRCSPRLGVRVSARAQLVRADMQKIA